jgi:hypothetical protein
MGMIADIRSSAEYLGYTVHASRQEKLAPKELVIILDDVQIEIETTLTYHANVFVTVEYDTSEPDDIPEDIISLVNDLEEELVYGSNVSPDEKATFKFVQSEVNMLGTMYRVIIIIEYTKVINLG